MNPYKNPALPVADRVADLVGRMTLKEKVAQLHHIWKPGEEDERPQFNDIILKEYGETGLGAIMHFWATDLYELQKAFMEKSRLGIPVSIVVEGLHGGAEHGTVFPMPLAMAAAWNPALLERAYTTIAKEARMVGANQTFSPCVDVTTEPRLGRVDEAYGEDPFLSSLYTEIAVRFMQGEHTMLDDEHIAATVKHFAAYHMAENGQDGGGADLSEQQFRERYLPPFTAAVQAGVKAVMPAHGEVNGVPCHANDWMLRTILREEWGFEGMVVSDAGDVGNLIAFGLARDNRDAGAQSLKAGVDQELNVFGYRHLEACINAGDVDEALIDEAVARVLKLKFECGLFDRPLPQISRPEERDTDEGRLLAYQIAAEGMVLLKNDDNLLPLDPASIRSVAVIGPNAESAKAMEGNYERGGAKIVTIAEGLRNRLPSDVAVKTAVGCSTLSDAEDDFAEAIALAQASDVVVLAMGDSIETCRECYATISGDRVDLVLPGAQEKLMRTIHAVNPRTILALVNGRPHALPEVDALLPAIVNVWRAGEEGGHALADILFGAVNPSGRLTITYPRHVGQLPAFYYKKKRGYLKRRHTFVSAEPLYPFGYGLSYSTFAWSNLQLSATQIAVSDAVGMETITVTVDVENTSERAGAEVVQLYANDILATVSRPMRQLVAFAKLKLEAGEKRTATMAFQLSQVGYHDRRGQFVIDEGVIELMAGRHARDTQLSAEIVIGDRQDINLADRSEADVMLIPD